MGGETQLQKQTNREFPRRRRPLGYPAITVGVPKGTLSISQRASACAT